MTDSKREDRIEKLSQAILDARAQFPNSSLGVLYDPDTMPPILRTAHVALDKAVDRLYQRATFASERERVQILFKQYEQNFLPLEVGKK